MTARIYPCQTGATRSVREVPIREPGRRAQTGFLLSAILSTPHCSNGTTQSRPYPARAVKIMGKCGAAIGTSRAAAVSVRKRTKPKALGQWTALDFYAGDRKARKLWLPGVTTDGAVMPEQSVHCRLAWINPLNGCHSETKGWHLDDWTAPHAEVRASVNLTKLPKPSRGVAATGMVCGSETGIYHDGIALSRVKGPFAGSAVKTGYVPTEGYRQVPRPTHL